MNEELIALCKANDVGLFGSAFSNGTVYWQACQSQVLREEGLPNLVRHGIGPTPQEAINLCLAANWEESK